ESGYHSAVTADPDTEKWVQVDLGKSTPIDAIVYVGCYDTFNNFGAGFGFPPRYKIEVSDDPEFREGVTVVADRSRSDQPNPGVAPQVVGVGGVRARFVRVSAARLATRSRDYIFALAELAVFTPEGRNAAAGANVRARDSIEAPPRWRATNLVDGLFPGATKADQLAEVPRLIVRRSGLLDAPAAEPT